MPDGEPRGYTVRTDDEHVACEYCGAPFADDDLLALHRGVEHEGRLTADQRDAFEAAYDAETEDLKLFRLQAIAVLIVLYFVLLMAFSVFA
jgi:hypothetical protein